MSLFSDIKPEDFFRETSAIRETPISHQIRGVALHQGEEGFGLFVDVHLEAVKAQVEAGGFVAAAVLSNGKIERLFKEDPDDTSEGFAARLQREAGSMGAYWLFTAMIGPGRVYEGDEAPPIDPEDLDAITEGLRSGALVLSVCWTAESVPAGGYVERRAGIIPIDEHHQLGEAIEGELDPSEDVFAEVLNGG